MYKLSWNIIIENKILKINKYQITDKPNFVYCRHVYTIYVYIVYTCHCNRQQIVSIGIITLFFIMPILHIYIYTCTYMYININQCVCVYTLKRTHMSAR